MLRILLQTELKHLLSTLNYIGLASIRLNLLLVISLSFHLIGHGQVLAEKSTNQQVALVEVLEQLKEKKQVSFLYEPGTIKGILLSSKINYNKDIKKILQAILPNLGLKYRKVGRYNYIIKKAKKKTPKKTIRLNQKPAKATRIHQPSQPAKQIIKGTIFDEETGEALIGATIQLKPFGTGTTTNVKGEYTLSIPIGKQRLLFSYIGFEDKELLIEGAERIDIGLKIATTNLDEVVVTAIGIEANKRLLAYSVDNFDIDAIASINEPNLVSAITAKSAGVWVNSTSGSPGASASIYIRGLRSVNGNNKPLFILDGMPVDNSTIGNGTGGVDVSNRLIDFNQHDIASMSILKGAAATALYGIRAANGAIVMTSRKGEKGKPRIQFSTAWGFRNVNRLPARQNTYTQGRFRSGEAVYMGPETNTATSYGPPISQLEFDGNTQYPYDKNGSLVPIGQGNGIAANTYDAYDAFFVQGHTMDHHLSISGGAKWFDYYLSFGQFRETGVVPRSSFDRYSIKANFGMQLHRDIKLRLSTNLVQSHGFRMKRGSQFSGVPLGLFRNPISFDIGNGLSGREAAQTSSTYLLANGQQRAFRGNNAYDNPFWTVNRNPFRDKVNRITQQLKLDYQLTPWLKAIYQVGFDGYTDNRENFYDVNSGTHRKGRIQLIDISSTNINSDLLLIAEHALSKQWSFRGTLGHNYFSTAFPSKEIIGDELVKQGLFTLSNAINITTDEDFPRKKVVGSFLDLHFQFKNTLYLNFTGRNDWSSTLPAHQNSFFYPSLNVGFEFTDLPIWQNSKLLPYGKLRLSLSQVGNDAGYFLTNNYFRPAIINGDDLLPNVDFPAFGNTGFERSGILGNSNLRPETATTLEIGTDLRWFKGRLNLDISWYRSVHKDQIINTQLSATSAYFTAPINTGVIKNEGLELMANFSPIRKKDFGWDISLNFSTFSSIVSDLPGQNAGIVLASYTRIASVIQEGQPYGVLVGSSIERDEQGRAVIDQDGFPKVNDTHTVIGDPNPDWLMGIRQTFRWKQFSLNALLDIRKGGDIWNGTRGVMSYLGMSKTSGDLREVRGYVFEGVTEQGEINTKPVDFANPANDMGGIYWRRYGFLGLAENHIEEGSWVRLRELTLSYRFTSRKLKNSPRNILLSLTGHNVFLLTKYTGVDPETNLRGDSNILGWDYFNMPSTKGWSIQLKANF